MELLDRSRRREDCVPSFLWLDASVRCAAMELDDQVRDPFPGADDIPVGAGALEDEGGVVLGGEGADVMTRER